MTIFHSRPSAVPGVVLGIVIALLAGHAQAQPAYQTYQPTQQDPYLVIQGPARSTGYASTDFPASSTTYSAARPASPAAYPTNYVESQRQQNAPSSTRTLATQTGLQLGLQGSYYDYDEPTLGVELKGAKFGVNPIGTLAFGSGFFMTADLRFALGNSDYKGSGTNGDNFEDLWDLRALVGHDFVFNDFSLSPYAGFGYRRLYSDERGTTSTGFGGYRRTNELYYIPLGVTPRLRLDSESRLAATLEVDPVVHGNQNSKLNDVSGIYPELNNSQDSGYGLRGDISYERGRWSLGPFINYWHIDTSKRSCGQTFAGVTCGTEPENNTIEGGFQVRYRLL